MTQTTNHEMDYFQRMQYLSETQPGRFDKNVSIAEFNAEQDANRFLNILQDIQNEAYSETVKIFTEKFEAKAENVRKHFMDLRLKEREKEREADIKTAETTGKKQASEFLSSLLDFNSDSYTTNVRILRDELGGDPDHAEEFFTDIQYKRHGLTRIPKRNGKYESSLVDGFVPANKYEEVALKSLVHKFESLWRSRGYNSDSELYKSFLAESLPISGNPTFLPRK